jgi:hypothetical protein
MDKIGLPCCQTCAFREMRQTSYVPHATEEEGVRLGPQLKASQADLDCA